MELDFHKSPAILEHIADTLVAGIFTVDATGRFVAWNKGAERITGYLARDLIGQQCAVLEGPNCKGFAALVDLLRDHSSPTQGMCQQECKLLSKDGREVHIHGNVRELRNAIEHASVLASGDRISYFDLPPEIRGVTSEMTTVAGLTNEQAEEKERILQALRQAAGNRTKAASALGTSRVTLWKKISRYGIQV